MAKMEFDSLGKRLYEIGVDKVALFPMKAGVYGAGVPWNGITAINEKPEGAEATGKYADNIKYLNLVSAEDFKFGIEAFTAPDEFGECDGSLEAAPGMRISGQNRSAFGLVYRTLIGNDTEGDSHGYKLHVVYGAMAAPSEKAYATKTEDPDAMTMSWDCTTTPVAIEGHPEMRPTAHIEISSVKAGEKIKKIEEALYGSLEAEPKLLMPGEIITMLTAEA